MRRRRPRMRFLVAAMAVLAITGCAGVGGRVVPVEPGDISKLAGTWQGTMILPSGVGLAGDADRLS